MRQETVQDILSNYKDGGGKMENISDGYHTFAELYEFRKMYNVVLFNEWAAQKRIWILRRCYEL